MADYSDTVRAWASDLRRSGPLKDADGTGEVGLGAGEIGRRLAVRFAIRVRENLIESVRFEVFGCGFTIAACAAAAELCEGRTLEEAKAITSAEIDTVLNGLPAERGYCSEIAADALQAAIESACNTTKTVRVEAQPLPEGTARIEAGNPLYRLLMESPRPEAIEEKDRHLFACVFAVAEQEPWSIEVSLGLRRQEVAEILAHFFPTAQPHFRTKPETEQSPPEQNDDILEILLSHVPKNRDGQDKLVSRWLAYILAARAAVPGHLWVAMGFFERPELTAAIGRHLPSLAAANNQGMRWKRYLFKQACDMGGGVMCKAPDCGECSDYSLCFDVE